MARRMTGPALYELLQSRIGQRPTVVEEPVRDEPVESEGSGLRWLSPGQTVRVPVGYLILAAALSMVLMAGTYIMGHRTGGNSVRNEFQREFGRGGFSIQDTQHPDDPLSWADPDQSDNPTSAAGFSQPTGNKPLARYENGVVDPHQWGPPMSDPRQPGKHYFIVFHLNREGAERVVAFCREHGLEAYAARGNNRGLFKIVILPGFDLSEKSSPAIRQLEQQIHRVGDIWKSIEGGARDFRGSYASLYQDRITPSQ